MLLLFGIIASLFITGLFLFSFVAGTVLYFSSLTTDHAELEPGQITRAEPKSPVHAHTHDMKIMDPLNAAKARWFERYDKGYIHRHEILSEDGLLLYGYCEEPEQPVGRAVLLVHGMLDSAAGLGYLSEEYLRRGWHVFSIDLRSHGQSEGTKRSMGIRESRDIAGWVAYFCQNYNVNTLFLHGISMGGASVLMYAAGSDPLHSAVKGVISDSSFARYDEIFERLVLLIVRNRIIARCVVCGTSCAAWLFDRIKLSRMRPGAVIHLVQVPVLLFHGNADVLVPLGSVQELFSTKLKPGSQRVVIPDAPHIGPYFYAPEIYMKKIVEFTEDLL